MIKRYSWAPNKAHEYVNHIEKILLNQALPLQTGLHVVTCLPLRVCVLGRDIDAGGSFATDVL